MFHIYCFKYMLEAKTVECHIKIVSFVTFACLTYHYCLFSAMFKLRQTANNWIKKMTRIFLCCIFYFFRHSFTSSCFCTLVTLFIFLDKYEMRHSLGVFLTTKDGAISLVQNLTRSIFDLRKYLVGGSIHKTRVALNLLVRIVRGATFAPPWTLMYVTHMYLIKVSFFHIYVSTIISVHRFATLTTTPDTG